MTFGLPILTNISGITGPGQKEPVDILIGTVTVFGVFGWIWSIANELHKKLPAGERFKLWRFRIVFFIALAILIWVFWITERNTMTDNELPIILLSVPIYLGLMILFAAKTFKTVELGRPANIDEYGVDAFLIWMIPLGVWIMQPRLNKLTDD